MEGRVVQPDVYACLPTMDDEWSLGNISDSSISMAVEIVPAIANHVYGGGGGTMIRMCEKKNLRKFFEQISPHHLEQLRRHVEEFGRFVVEGETYFVHIELNVPYEEQNEVYSMILIDYIEVPKKISAKIEHKYGMKVKEVGIILHTGGSVVAEFGLTSKGTGVWNFNKHVLAYCDWCNKLLHKEEWKNCSGCFGKIYCDPQCQKKAWRIHRKKCGK